MFIFFSDPSVAVGTGPFKPGLDKEILLENKRLQTQLARLGGKADPSTLTADESSEAKFMSKLEKDNELLFNDNRTLLEENQTLMREIERLKQGRPATDSPLSGVDGAGSIFNSLRGGPDNSQAPSRRGDQEEKFGAIFIKFGPGVAEIVPVKGRVFLTVYYKTTKNNCAILQPLRGHRSFIV